MSLAYLIVEIIETHNYDEVNFLNFLLNLIKNISQAIAHNLQLNPIPFVIIIYCILVRIKILNLNY